MSKYDDVLKPFVLMMEKELHANSEKGDRPGWLAMSTDTCLLEIIYHFGKLQASVKRGDIEGITEYAADVANMSMMLVDICGALPAQENHISERDQLKAENEALCAKVSNLNVSGFAEAFYTVAEKLGVTGARPVSPMQVFASEVLPALQSAIKDAERYRWLRDKSENLHGFYLSTPLWMTGVRFSKENVGSTIDAAMGKGEQQ